VKTLILVLGSIAILGCAVMRPPKTTIWEPQTDVGRDFKSKYFKNLQIMVSELRKIKEIADIEGLLAKGVGSDSTSFYFGARLGTYQKYNILRTSFEERAATATAENALPILQTIGKQQEPISDSKVSGVYFSIAWTAADFSNIYSSGDLEGIAMYINRETLQDYLSFKISNQDLINRSTVIGYKNDRIIGRIQLNVGKNL